MTGDMDDADAVLQRANNLVVELVDRLEELEESEAAFKLAAAAAISEECRANELALDVRTELVEAREALRTAREAWHLAWNSKKDE